MKREIKTSLSAAATRKVTSRFERANRAFTRRYPGESGRRQPVHVVYGGAHLFQVDVAPKLGAAALRALQEYAPDAAVFAKAVGLPERLADQVYARVLEKLRREPAPTTTRPPAASPRHTSTCCTRPAISRST
jgi:hypothetical protein